MKTKSIWIVSTLVKQIEANIYKEKEFAFTDHQEALDFYDSAVESGDFLQVCLPVLDTRSYINYDV